MKKYLFLSLLGYWSFEILRKPQRRRYFVHIMRQVPYIPFRYLA